MAKYLHIGTVRRAHGLHGQVKVALDNAESEALSQIEHLWMGAPGSGDDAEPGQLRKWPLQEVRPLENGVYIVTLAGVADRTAAEALQLQAVYADRAELPALAEDEVYHADLLGCHVIGPGGETVGTIRSISTMSGNFLLVVERAGREDALVPLVPQIISRVDLAARTVEIDPPEGLLDLDRTGA